VHCTLSIVAYFIETGLLTVVNSLIPSADLVLGPTLKPPGDVQAKLLRQVVLSGLGDHVAR